jgi:hypothetical protein
VAAPTNAVGQYFYVRVQPNRYRALQYECAGVCIDECAAACGDNLWCTFDKPRNNPALSIAKIAFAELFEYFGNGKSRGTFNFIVSIGKRHIQPRSQALSNAAFTHAHHPDKNDRPVNYRVSYCSVVADFLFIVSGHCDTAYISAIPNPKVICHLFGKLWESSILHNGSTAADVKTGFCAF